MGGGLLWGPWLQVGLSCRQEGDSLLGVSEGAREERGRSTEVVRIEAETLQDAHSLESTVSVGGA